MRGPTARSSTASRPTSPRSTAARKASRSTSRPTPTARSSRSCSRRPTSIVENFRPGTMEKLGYGWDTLHKKYPKLIYASASGFGHTGPNSKDPAYDMVVQGMGGIMSITGNEGQPPARVGMSIGDIGAGLYTAVAVNAALVHRLKTGEVDQGRHRHVRLPAGAARERHHALHGRGRGPRPARRAPSHHHAVPGLRARRTAPSSSPPATTACSSRPARRSAVPTWRPTPTTRPTRCARSITASSSARSNRC